jgi:hypothetical protein
MSAEERAEALAEAVGRFGAEKLEMLRRRAAAARGQQGQGRSERQPAAEGEATIAAQQAKAPAKAALRRGFLGPPPKPCAVQQLQQQQPQPAPSLVSAPAAAGPAPEQRRPLVARLRFGLAGEVVGADAPGAAPAPAEAVLQRDLLSRDRGLAPEGYTLDELQALARSSHAPQRAAALRAVGALLAAARPRAGGVAAGGALVPRPVPLPESVLER